MPVVLVDEHIYGIQSLSDIGFSVKVIQHECPLLEQSEGCDALLIRTVHKITRTTFPTFPSQLRFIGTATAGTDHLDIPWIKNHGITVGHSPGCNAQAVAEYVITGILFAFQFDVQKLQKRTVGIIGHGQTGGKVSALLDALGIAWKAYDPPKANQASNSKYVSFEEVLACDILTLHVPLTFDGDYPTHEMIHQDVLANRTFDLFINAARGGVTNEEAVLWGLETGRIKHVITDVWKGEPSVHPTLVKASLLATPHIAGYSIQGKMEATRMVCQQLLDTFKINKRFTIYDTHQTENLLTLDASKGLGNLLQRMHPMFELSQTLKKQPGSFSILRNTHPLRQEFSRWIVTFLSESDKKLAQQLGCKIEYS